MENTQEQEFKPEVLREPRENESEEIAELRRGIVAALRTVYDPEIPVNIYDLGLIYDIDIDTNKAVRVRMTLTTPNCPVAGVLPGQVEAKTREVPGVADCKVDLVWEPMWGMHMMSEVARLKLNL